ncbi:MAG: hypothetical protein WB511_11030 [Nitrososphaeraceae archaeon]
MTLSITVTGYYDRVSLVMSKLDDAMQEHMAYLVFSEKRPFSYIDFLQFEVDGKIYGMKHGTFRNKITKLRKKGEVERLYCSPRGFYTLNGGHKFGKPVTPNHMGVSPNNTFYQMINDLPLDKQSLHDIRLWFKVRGIWSILSSNSTYRINLRSKDIPLPGIKEGDLFIGITVHHSDSVSVRVGCSYTPIAVDINGVIRLSSALTIVKERLSSLIRETVNLTNCDVDSLVVPPYTEWIVKMWHFGRDASIEYSGEKFEMTFLLATGILIRVYSKQMKGKKTNIRLERQEYPNIPLVDAIEARLHSTENNEYME